MKWFAQYFLSPLFAASLAVWGNYYFIQKDQLEKEYTKIGVDILLQKNSPEHIKNLGNFLIEKNSPISLGEAEKNANLKKLTHNIPYKSLFEGTPSYGDFIVGYTILASWAKKVSFVCPDCINQSEFDREFIKLNKILHKDKDSKK